MPVKKYKKHDLKILCTCNKKYNNKEWLNNTPTNVGKQEYKYNNNKGQ
jgi:hypothetical protein